MLRRTAALAAIAAAFGAATDTAAAGQRSLGPPPHDCVRFEYDRSLTCLKQSRALTLSITPKVVSVGDTVTATVTAHFNGPVSWRWSGLALGRQLPGCGPQILGEGNDRRTPTSGTSTCTYRTTAPTNGWRTEILNHSTVQGGTFSRDYVAILGDEYGISGHIRDVNGAPLPGVVVGIRGPEDVRATTDQRGFYYALVERGRYEVGARARVCVIPIQNNRCSPGGTVRVPPSRTVDFQAPAQGAVRGTVLDHRGRPVGGVRIEATGGPANATQTATTRDDGTYELPLGPGSYTVGAPPRQVARDTYTPNAVPITVDQVPLQQDFRMENGDFLELDTEFSDQANRLSSEFPINGTTGVLANATLKDARDRPVTDQRIEVGSPAWVAAPSGFPPPRAVFCGLNGELLAPTGSSTPLAAFAGPTDDAGQLAFKLFPGTTPGDASLEAHDAANPTRRDSFSVEFLRLQAETPGPLPPPTQSETGENPFNAQLVDILGGAGIPRAAISAADLQDRLLDYLTSRRMNGLAVAPIRAGENAAVLVYRPAALPEIEAFLGGQGDPVGLDDDARVISIDRFLLETANPRFYVTLRQGYRVLLPGESTFVSGLGEVDNLGPKYDSVMDVRQWITGTHRSEPTVPATPAHGQPVKGRVRPWPQEELTFFGGPYPSRELCLPPDPFATEIDVFGNPARPRAAGATGPRVLVKGPNGTVAGVDRRGRTVGRLPGAVVIGDGTRLRIKVPRGSYRLEVLGGASALRVGTAFFGRVPRGATARLSRSGARAIKAGRRTIRARRGAPLRVTGIPRRVRAGRPISLTVRVRSPLGPVAGAIVRAGDLTVASDAHGNAAIALPPLRRGRLAVRVTAPGHAAATRSVRVGA